MPPLSQPEQSININAPGVLSESVPCGKRPLCAQHGLGNPVKYRDPTGHWVETAFDVVSVGFDIAAVKQDPSFWNVAALVVDAAAVIVPIVPSGAGWLARGGRAAKAAVEIASHTDEAVGALTHADDAAHLLAQSNNVQAAKALEEYDVVAYRTKASGFQKHHGVLDMWAKMNNLENYSTLGSPTVLLTAANHNLTRGVFNNWKYQNFGSVAAKVDWTRVSPNQIQALAEQMFDAAKVPSEVRQQYYRDFAQLLYEGKWE
jgi:hypothetical protein